MARASQAVAFIVAVLAGLFFIAMPLVNPASDPGAPDMSAYWLAAMRLRDGEPLYAPAYADTGEVYRYAPWFAVAWLPLTLLPQPVAYFVWEAMLLASALYVIWTLAQLGRPGLVMAAMALPLIGAVPGGNVTNLMLALLIWRRSDPVSVGLAGSLKLYPLLLCAGYVAERRWRDLAIALGVAGALWLPALLAFDASILEGQREATVPALLGIPVLAAVCVFAILGSRWTWLAAAAAMPLAVPHYVSIGFTWVAARRLTVTPSGLGRSAGWPCRMPRWQSSRKSSTAR